MSSTSALEVLAQMAPRDLNKLKCKKCRKLLIPPVYTTGSNGSVCGRCPRPEEPNTVRATTFETLAKYVQFPCTYQNEGCKAVLRFEDVLSHENNCPVAAEKIIKCPVCNLNWNIVDTHLDQIHRNDLPVRAFPINISVPRKTESNLFYLILRNNDGGPYVLSIVANPDKDCDITLYSFTQPCEELRYNVKAISSDAKHSTVTLGIRKTLAPCRPNSSKTLSNTCFVFLWLKRVKEILGCNNFYFSVDLMKVLVPVLAVRPAAVPEAMNAERPAALPIELPSTELTVQPAAVSADEVPAKVTMVQPATGTAFTSEPSEPIMNAVEVVKMINSLEDELTCWVCKQSVTLPIMQTHRTHFVCDWCKEK